MRIFGLTGGTSWHSTARNGAPFDARAHDRFDGAPGSVPFVDSLPIPAEAGAFVRSVAS